MANAKALKVAAKLGTKGMSATLSWPNNSLNQTADIPDVTVNCALESKEASPGTYVLKAYLPATDQQLEGATITIAGEKHKITHVMKFYDGEEVVLQEASLS